MATFSPYDQLAMSQYTPLSQQEILMPAMMQRERHDKLDEAYGEIGDKIEQAGALLEANPNNPRLKQMYDAYVNDLSQATDMLMERGVTPESTRTMFGLKSRYQSQVAPVSLAAQLRAADLNAYQQLKAKDPSYEGIDPSVYSLDSYLENGLQARPQVGISGKDVYEQSRQMAAPLSRLLHGSITADKLANPEIRKLLFSSDSKMTEGALLKLTTKYGLNLQDVQNARNNPRLQEMLQDLESAWDFGRLNDSAASERLRKHAEAGLYAGIGQDDVKFMNSPLYEEQLWKMREWLKANAKGNSTQAAPTYRQLFDERSFNEETDRATTAYGNASKQMTRTLASAISTIGHSLGISDNNIKQAYDELKKTIKDSATKKAKEKIKQNGQEWGSVSNDVKDALIDSFSVVETERMMKDPDLFKVISHGTPLNVVPGSSGNALAPDKGVINVYSKMFQGVPVTDDDKNAYTTAINRTWNSLGQEAPNSYQAARRLFANGVPAFLSFDDTGTSMDNATQSLMIAQKYMTSRSIAMNDANASGQLFDDDGFNESFVRSLNPSEQFIYSRFAQNPMKEHGYSGLGDFIDNWKYTNMSDLSARYIDQLIAGKRPSSIYTMRHREDVFNDQRDFVFSRLSAINDGRKSNLKYFDMETGAASDYGVYRGSSRWRLDQNNIFQTERGTTSPRARFSWEYYAGRGVILHVGDQHLLLTDLSDFGTQKEKRFNTLSNDINKYLSPSSHLPLPGKQADYEKKMSEMLKFLNSALTPNRSEGKTVPSTASQDLRDAAMTSLYDNDNEEE